MMFSDECHMACVCDVITVEDYFEAMDEIHRLVYEAFERGNKYEKEFWKEEDTWTWET